MTSNRWGWAVMAAVAVLSLARPAPGYDPEATFAKGTKIFGLQVGGGASNNVEGHRTVSEISFVTELPKTVSGKIRRVELRQKR